MHIVLFDLPEDRIKLFPLSLTRPISFLRVGILTIGEKWQRCFPESVIHISSHNSLEGKFGKPCLEEAIWINAAVLPSLALVKAINTLKTNESIFSAEKLVAFKGKSIKDSKDNTKSILDSNVDFILRSWDLFSLNAQEIKNDFALITKGRISKGINDPYTRTYGNDIFVEEGVSIMAAVLNAEEGPIYLGKDAEIQEGALIRGPFALGEGSTVKMGAKIRNATTIGPYCKAGGEISNTILMGYTNKAHDGFLGNSVIGEWCNIGADSNNSNLKNNYDGVKMWDHATESFIPTGLQFCGLIMGDHSKCSINSMFNTGTTIGVSSNIFGAGFPRNIVHSFSWGGAAGFTTYQLDKALKTAELVMNRRKISLDKEDKAILKHIFENHSIKQ